MEETRPREASALGANSPAGAPAPDGPSGRRPPRARLPRTSWPPWSAPVALVAGLVLAALGGVVVDVPAVALGVKISSSHTPPGIAIADTFVQDVGFVIAAVLCARIGGRTLQAWQLGLRPPVVGWRRAVGMICTLIVAFLLVSLAWAAIFNPGEEKLLEQLGSNEGAALLVLSAALTCVIAPICEEVLFRGFIFSALRNWRGTLPAAIVTGLLFGAVHAGSAPALDLVPLAALGFGLCLLYSASGSLYPCFVAHALNNSIAFASLEGWNVGEGVLLFAGAVAGIGALVIAAKRVGLISAEPARAGPVPTIRA